MNLLQGESRPGVMLTPPTFIKSHVKLHVKSDAQTTEPMLLYDLYADPKGGLGSFFSFCSFISAKNSIELEISSLPFLCKQQNYNYFSFMASQDPIQEVEGDYRNSKTSFVKGVRMPFFYVYKTGFEEFIDKFQTRIDDVFIVGIP